MNLDEFAARYQLKVKKDSCGDAIIPGRLPKWALGSKPEDCHHAYEHDGRLALWLTFDTKRKWQAAKKRLGLEVFIDDDTEGTLLLDPADERGTRLALRLAGIRVKRQLSAAAREAAGERLRKTREQ